MGLFKGTQERVRNSRDKLDISVRAIEGPLIVCLTTVALQFKNMFLCYIAVPECTDMTSGAIFNNKAYNCTLLLDQTDLSGVYENRISVCADNDTQCCSTCKEVTRVCQYSNLI